jgi:hypothetical protein
VRISDSTFGGNANGITNLIDSYVVNADFANNSNNGIYLSAGSNANTITNCRFEWNQGNGIEVFGGTVANTVSNSLFDRNYKAGIRLVDDRGMSISNVTLYRNGRNTVAPDQNTQIFMSNVQNVSISGGVSRVGQDDGATGTFTPSYAVTYSGTTSNNIVISGLATAGLFNSSTNLYGSYTVAAVQGVEPTIGYSVNGVNDIPTTSRIVSGLTAFASGGQAGATPMIAAINTVATAASPNASVRLVPCVPGRQQVVANRATNPVQVYGTAPDTINGIASATGINLASGKTAVYFCTGTNSWSQLLSN